MSIDRISVFRLKSSVTQFQDFIRIADAKGNPLPTFRALILPDLSDFDGEVAAYATFREIVSARRTDSDIPWLDFINGCLTDPFPFSWQNKFPTGAILLSIQRGDDKRFYALTFGLGAESLIETDLIETDFGIRVAMNICKDGDLKRVQTSIHESVSTQSERQISAGGRVSAFYVDSEREFLQRLSGKAKEEFSYVASFSGKEGITVKFDKNDDLDWEKLVQRVDALGAAATLDDYRTLFDGYDRFVYISDRVKIAELDTNLFELIRLGETQKIHLAIPEFLDFDIVNFCYDRETDADQFDDLSLDDWINSRKQRFRENSSIATLKRAHVYAFNVETNTFGKRWTIYKCLVAEVSIDGEVFVLSMGQWRRVSSELQHQVENYVSTITTFQPEYLVNNVSIWSTRTKPDGTTIGSNEESEYNKYVRNASPELYLFDRAKIEIAGEKRYEVCDLLHESGVFIHAKRFQSGSASISHVFVQARLYAEAIFSDTHCRYSMQEHIRNRPEGRNVQAFVDLIALSRDEMLPPNFSVLFCILTDTPDLTLANLPFMARYELTRTHKFLKERIGIGRCQVCFPTVVLGPPQTE